MDINERMFWQKQRDQGNPYKEGSRSWLAWAKGYTYAQLASVVEEWNKRVPKKHRVNLNFSSTRSDK